MYSGEIGANTLTSCFCAISKFHFGQFSRFDLKNIFSVAELEHPATLSGKATYTFHPNGAQFAKISLTSCGIIYCKYQATASQFRDN